MGKGKILIVDDDPLVRDVLVNILSDIGGYETDIAVDGLDGIGMVKNNGYDMIFTDLTMPRLNGMDLLKETVRINPFLPVVFITGFSTIDNAINAMKDGARDFITKPFKINQVISTADRIMGERSLLERFSDEGNNKAAIKRLNSELFKKLQEIATLQFISGEIDELHDNKDIYDRIAEMALRLVAVKETSFGIVENGYLKIKNSIGATQKDIPIACNIFEDVMKNKKYCAAGHGCINPHTGMLLTESFLSIPLIIKDEVFGMLNLSGKVDGTTFSDDEIATLLTFSKKISMRIENNALYDILYNNLVNTLKSLVTSIEARDFYTMKHSERVTMYSLQIAEVMGFSDDDKDTISFGGYLHDIGKIGIGDAILLKSESLTLDEMAEIRLHPVKGDNIIKPMRFLSKIRDIIKHHHERFDGKGYPDGIAGEDIPLVVRMLTVADAYDAMTSSRPYRTARSHDFAIEELVKCSGLQFDREVVNAFLQTSSGKGKGYET